MIIAQPNDEVGNQAEFYVDGIRVYDQMCIRDSLNGERLEQLSERELQALRRGAVEGWG